MLWWTHIQPHDAVLETLVTISLTKVDTVDKILFEKWATRTDFKGNTLHLEKHSTKSTDFYKLFIVKTVCDDELFRKRTIS